MTSLLTGYSQTTAVTITCSIAGLVNGAARQSTAISNVSGAYLDGIVEIQTKGTAGATLTLDVYAYASVASSSPLYSDGATGTDGTFTNLLGSVPNVGPPNSVLLGQVLLNGTTTMVAGPWGVAEKFGGTLPPSWGLICVNNSGATLDGTAGNHIITYVGIFGLIS